MSDAKRNPAATPDRNPQHQVGESKGTIKGPQALEGRKEEMRWDVPAGSEGDRRRASKGER